MDPMFSRIGRLLRGFLGLFVSGLEEANPEALMEAARQDFRQKMTQYNLALAKMAGVAERLKVQVKGKAARAQDLERRILANHRAGNLELAGRSRASCRSSRPTSPTDTQELKETEEAYQVNLRQAKVTQQEFQDKVRKLEKQLSQVQIKEAQAEAATALSSVAFKVGDLGDTMKTVEDILEKRYEVSAGKARVAQRHGGHATPCRRRKPRGRRSSRTRSPSSSRARASRPRRASGSTATPAVKEMGPER